MNISSNYGLLQQGLWTYRDMIDFVGDLCGKGFTLWQCLQHVLIVLRTNPKS